MYFASDNVDVDCPVFDGLFRYCQLYTGGSIGTFQGIYVSRHSNGCLEVQWVVFVNYRFCCGIVGCGVGLNEGARVG